MPGLPEADPPLRSLPRWSALVGVVSLLLAPLSACQPTGSSAADPSSLGGGLGPDAGVSCGADPEAPGCPCSAEGTESACYPGYSIGDDGALSCEIGTHRCEGGQWTACGDVRVETYPASPGALIGPVDTCNPCNPLCFRGFDIPTCDTTPGGSCDLCTPERAATTGCTINTDTTSYDPGRGGITPHVDPSGGTPPPLPDSDGDGIPDIADECVGPGAFRAADGSCYGALFFYHMMPYGGPAAIDPLPLSIQVRTADVYILMDTTGSMGGELSRLKTDLTAGSFLSGCGNGILGAIRCTIPDAWFGVGYHDDFPYSPFGGEGYDYVYRNVTSITETLSSAQAGVNSLAIHWGNDGPESQLPAMWAVATGNGMSNWTGNYLSARTGCPAGRWGYPCFRAGTIPILINITDAPYHNGPTIAGYSSYNYYSVPAPSWSSVVSAISSREIRVITVQSCGYWTDSYCKEGEAHAKALGNATGSLGSSGAPYVFRINDNGTGLSSTVVNAVVDLANYSRMDISARASGDSWGFTKTITAVSWGPGGCTGISGGTTFTQCLPGTHVNFNVQFQNTSVMPTATAQVFSFFIEVVGNGTTVLERVPVRIVVPAMNSTLYDPEGRYWRDFDSTMRCDPITSCADWSQFTWTADVPAGTQLRFEFRTANSAAAVPSATPVATHTVTTSGAGSLDVGMLLEAAGARNLLPFLRVTAVLVSSADRRKAPALNRMELTYSCQICS